MRKQLLIALAAFLLLVPLGLSAQRPVIYLTEDFNSGIPSTWDVSDNQSTSYMWKTSTAGRNSTSCAYFYAYSTYTASMKTPAFTLPANRDCMLTFWMKNSSSYQADLDIYVSTDGGATYLSNPVVSNLDDGGTWTYHQILLNAWKGQSIKLVFDGRTNGSNYAYYYIDDVTVQTAPTCQASMNAYASNLQPTQVEFNWGLAGTGFGDVPDSFAIRLVSGGTELSNVTHYMPATGGAYLYTQTGLTPNTTYTAYISSNCEAAYSGTNPEETSVTFTTPMIALPLPYEELFDNITSLPAGSYGHNAIVSADYSFNPGRSAKLTTTATDNAWLLFPPLDVEADQFEMDFRIYTTSTARPQYYVGYATDPSDVGSSFVPMLFDSVVVNGVWHSYRFNTANTGDNTRPIMPCILVDGGASLSVYFDELRVHSIPTCLRPEHVTCTSFDDVSATFTWDTSNAPTVLFHVSDVNDSLLFTRAATAQPYVLTGLNAQTTYKIRLQGVCSTTDSTDLTDPYTLTTQCGKVTTFPLVQDFEDASFSQCWRTGRTGATAMPSRSTSNATSGSYCFYMPSKTAGNYSWIASPPITFTAGQPYYFSMNMYRGSGSVNNTNEMVQVYVGPSPDDVSQATLLGTVCQNYLNAPVEPAVGNYSYYFTIPATVSGTQYIVVRYQSQNGSSVYVDDLTVNQGTFCAPLRGTAGNVVENSAEIRLSETPAHWQVAYGVHGTDIADCAIADTTNSAVYTLTGLQIVTQYDYYIRRICGAGDTSAWSQVRSFTTTEVPARAPYICGFEDATENAAWSITTSANNRLIVGTDANAVYSGTGALHVATNSGTSYTYNKSNSTSDNIYATRLVNFGSGNYEISFKWKCTGGESSYDYARVMLVPAGTNLQSTLTSYSSSVPNSIMLGGGGNYTDANRRMNYASGTLPNGWNDATETVDMTGREGNWLFVVYWHDDTSGGSDYPFSIDDIFIGRNTCPRPQNLTSVMTANGSSLSWTAGSTETQWEVSCALTMGTQSVFDTTFITTNTTATLTGFQFQPSSHYTINAQVRGICAPGDTSAIATYATSFDTPCGTVNMVSEGFEGSTFPPNCWTKHNTGGSDYPSLSSSSTYVHAGSGAAYFPDQSSSYSQYLATPPIDFGDSLQYRVSFWMYRSSSYSSKPTEGFQIWVGPNAGSNNATQIGFVPRYIGAAPVVSSTGIYYYEFDVPASIHGVNYVTFLYDNQFGSGSGLDDINIFPLATCQPTSATVSAVTKNTALVTADSTGIRQQVAYGTAGTVVDNCTIIDTVGNVSVPLTGLTPRTQYVVYVRRVCTPGDTSLWSTGELFTTSCDTMALPIVEDFASTVFPPSCWQIGTTGSSLPSRSTSTYVTTGSVYFPSQSSGNFEWITTPPIIFEADSSYRITFWANRTTGTAVNEGVYVYASSSADNVNGATLIGTVHRCINQSPTEGAAGFYEYEFYLPSTVVGEKYIIFRYLNEGSGAMYIDDISIECGHWCPKPTVNVSNVTDIDAAFSVGSTATDWQLAYGLQGTDLTNMTVVTVNGPTYSLTGLTSSTTYDYYVRRICAAGDTSAWGRLHSFTTTASIARPPYNTSFDDAQDNVAWQFANYSSSYNNFTIGTGTSRTGSNSLYIRNGSSTDYSYNTGQSCTSIAYRPIMFTDGGFQIEFKWKAMGESSNYDFGRVFLLPAGTAITATAGSYYPNATYPQGAIFLDEEYGNYLNGYSQNKNTDTEGWNTASVFVDLTGRAGVYYLCFYWNNDGSGGSQPPLAIEDLHVYELTCLTPTNTVVSGLSPTTAQISYTQNNVTKFDVIVDTVNIDLEALPDTPYYRGVDTTGTTSLTGLTQNTRYYYTIRAICDVGDSSTWKRVASFDTYCSPYTLPYNEDFESPVSVNCWLALDDGTGTATGTISHSTSYRHRGTASMRVAGIPAISPEFVVDSLTLHMINGWAYATTDSATFGVGVMTDPNDISTYETVGNVLIPQRNTWTEFTAYFTDLDLEDYEDFRYAHHIVLAPGNETVYFDDILVDLTPDCPKPTEPQVTNITSSSFDLSFLDHANATSWTVQAITGLDTITQVINSNPATITGLTQHTAYEVLVKADCGSIGMSNWTYVGRINTQCDVARLPYFESFEAMPTSYDPDNCSLICWDQIGACNINSSYPRYYGATSYYSDGAKSLFISGASQGIYLIMPQFSNSQRCQMTFTTRFESTSSSGDLHIGYITNFTDRNTFVPVDTVPKSSGTSVTSHTIDFDSVPAGARIAMHYINGNDNYYVWIDAINIVEVRNCATPNAPIVTNVTNNSADVTFTDPVSTHAQWEYKLIAPTADPDNAPAGTMLTAAGTVNLTGLTEQTDYVFYLRAICGVGDTSAWTLANFTTRCTPFHVTLLDTLYDSFEWSEFNTTLAGCYDLDPSGSTSYYVYGYGNTVSTGSPATYNTYTASGGRCVKVYNYSGTNQNGLGFSRELMLEAGKTYQMTVNAVPVSYNALVTLSFGTLANTTFGTPIVQMPVYNSSVAAQTLQSGDILYDYSGSVQEVTGFFSVPQDGIYFVGVNANGAATSSYCNVYFDDLMVAEYTGCQPITSATVDSLAEDCARIILNDSTQGSQYDYYLTNLNGDTVVAVTTTSSNVLFFDSLVATTNYVVHYRRNCGAGDVSPWISTGFKTLCGVVRTFPFTESFESAVPPTCWSQAHYGTSGSTGNFAQSSSYHHTGSYAAYKNDQSSGTQTALITPPLLLNSAYGFKAGVWVYRLSTSYQSYTNEGFNIYISPTDRIDNTSITNATKLGFVANDYRNSPAEATTGWYYYEFDIPAQCAGIQYLVIEYYNRYGAGGYVDDVSVMEIANCPDPTAAPAINDFTSTTVDVATPIGGHTAIEVGWTPGAQATDSDIVATGITTTNNYFITGLTPDSAYTVFYRIVCQPGDTSNWSTGTTVTMRTSDCYEPQNLAIVGSVDDHSAAISWTGAPLSTGYEYQLLVGTTVVDSGFTTQPNMSFTTLTSSTSYTFNVRSLCPQDTSVWATITFRTDIPTLAVPFICDFETVTDHSNWKMGFNSGSTNAYCIGTSTGGVNAGQYAMYISNNNSSYGYSTGTAAESYAYVNLLVPAGTYEISYDWKCYGESSLDYGRVYLLPETGTISATSFPTGSINLSQNNSYMNGQNNWQHFMNSAVTVPTTGIYKFVVTWRDDTSAGSNPFAIDNIFFGVVTCVSPQSISVVAVGDTTANIVVTKRNATDIFEYGYTTYNTADSVQNWQTNATAGASVSINLTGLAFGTNYNFYARTLCGSDDTSRVVSASFRTTTPPLNLPFVCNFEDVNRHGDWKQATVSGGTNLFTIGTDASGRNGGNYGLYISNNGSTYGYNTGTAVQTYTYVELNVPAGTFTMSYDWKCYGEGSFDHAWVYLVPNTTSITETNNTPTGAIILTPNSAYLSGNSSWSTYSNSNVVVPTAGIYKFVVSWKDDTSSGSNPIAVDNIYFGQITCPGPTGISLLGTTDTTATVVINKYNAATPIEWGYTQGTSEASVTNWTIDSTNTSTLTVTATGLTPLASYTLFARHICDSDDVSVNVSIVFAASAASSGSAQPPFATGFEATDDNTVWTMTNVYTNYFMIGSDAHKDGSQSLYITNNGSTRGYSNGTCYTYAYAELYMPAGAYTVNYDWVCEGESSFDYGRAFIVPASTNIPQSGAMSGLGSSSLPSGAICMDNNGQLNRQSSWQHVRTALTVQTAGSYKFVFYWYNDGSVLGTPPLTIDNFSVLPNVAGGDLYDTICFNSPYTGHGFNLVAGVVQPGDTSFFQTVPNTTFGAPDTTYTLHLHMFPEIVEEVYDTACYGVPYTGHGFSVPNPTASRRFTKFYTAANGCDSTYALNLYVVPTSEDRYDTICLGDAYQFGSRTLTGAGVYIDVIQNSYGCPDTVTLYLAVVDTGYVQTATICEGDAYPFEGRNYTQSGTYRVSSTGAHGCPVNMTLVLTVLPVDTTVNAVICSGGQVIVYDTIITTAGNYTMHRYDAAGCDVTWHINVTVAPPAEGRYTDDACEGRNYNNFGYYGPITADTVIMQTTKTSDMCDSITYVQITFHPTQTSEFTDHLGADGRYDWNDNTYTQAGDYQGTFRDQFGCDSIVTLHLLDPVGVDNIDATGSMKVVPNPVVKGQAAIVFTSGVGEIVRVEIINAYGAVVDGWEPHSSPIDLRAPEVSGVYNVRIVTKSGRVYVEKLIVQ